MSVRLDYLNLKILIQGNEAQNELNNLRKKAADLNSEMKGLAQSSDEYKAKAAELTDVTAAMDKLRQKLGLAALSMKELRQEQTKLTALRDSAVPFSDAYVDYQKQLTKVKDRIFEVKNGVEGFSATVLKAIPNIKAISTVTAVAFGAKVTFDWIKNGLSNLPKLSDQLADIQRVSGMTTQEVDNLNDSLKGLDTRTSYDGLNKIAVIAGKLGIAKQDIADFTEATDKMVVALGDELGDADQITTDLGKILNVFDGKITAENMLELGNAMVHMANSGVASAGYLADFTQRLSAMKDVANLSLPDVIGLGAAMEESGQRVESSSTAIVNLLGKMATNVRTFAKAAGKDVNDFAQTVQDKPIEALLQLAEGVSKNKQGLIELSPVFKDLGVSGSRVTATLSLMAGKADFFRQKMAEAGESIQGTGEIQDAFALKNNNLAGQLDKFFKNISRGWQSSGLARWLGEALGGVNNLISPTQNLTQAFYDQANKLNDLRSNVNKMVPRYEELKNKTNLNKAEQAELNKIMGYLAANIPGVVTEMDKYGNILSINTGKVREYIKAEQDRLKVVNADAISDWSKKRTAALKTAQEAEAAYNEVLTKGTITNIVNKGTRDQTTYTIKATGDAIGRLKQRADAAKSALNGIDQEMKRLSGGNLTTPNTAQKGNEDTTGSVVIPPDEKAAKSAARAAAKEKTAYQKLMEDIAKMRTELDNKDEYADDQEVARIQSKYDDLLRRAKKYADAKFQIEGLREKELFLLQEKRWKEQDKKYQEDQQKKIAKDNDDIYTGVQSQTDLLGEKRKTQAAKDYLDGKMTFKQYNLELAKIDEDTTNQKMANAEMASSASKKAEADLVTYTEQQEQKKRDSYKRTVEAQKEADKAKVDTASIKAETVSLTTPQYSSKNLDAQKALLKAQHDYELKYFTGMEEEKAALQENYHARVQDAEKQHWLAMLDYTTQYIDSFSSAFSSLNTFITNRETAELNKQKKNDDAKKKSYEKQLDGKLISQKQYDAKVQDIDDAADEREKVAARKQAEREKALNLFNAITSNAAAIVKTMQSVPYPFNIPLAIAQGIAGGLQIAAIANTPLPELGDGGLLTEGPKHKDPEKGLVVLNPRTGKTEMLLERNEAVLSSKTMDDRQQYTVSGTPSQIASALNGLNGGSTWDSGATVRQMTWANAPAPNINTDVPRILESGGALNYVRSNNTSSGSQTDALLATMVEELRQTRQDMSTWKTKLQAIVSLRQLDDTRALYDTAKNASGF